MWWEVVWEGGGRWEVSLACNSLSSDGCSVEALVEPLRKRMAEKDSASLYP